MTTRTPSRRERGDGLGGAFLDRVGDDDQAGELAVDRDEHHALAFGRAARPRRVERGRVDPEVAEQRLVAERHLVGLRRRL